MARTKQEVRAWLESKVGSSIPTKPSSSLDGQCVTFIKALLEFLGAPEPYKARGNARTAGDAYIAQGIGTNDRGWLTICVNRTMGSTLSDGTKSGHIWIELPGEANYEQNGKLSKKVSKNSRPISQAQQFVNFDKWIKGEVVDDMSKTDERIIGILGWAVLGRLNALDGQLDPDLKNHVGGETNAKILEFANSPESKGWVARLREMVAYFNQKSANDQKVIDLSDKITVLEGQLLEKPKEITKTVIEYKNVPAIDIRNGWELIRDGFIKLFNKESK